MRAFLGELKLGSLDWMSVIDALPTVLNEADESRLGRNSNGSTRSPLEAMTGIKPRRAIVQIFSDIPSNVSSISLEHATAELFFNIAELQNALHEMHKDVKQRINDHRRRSIKAHNGATNIVTPNFEVGDFVVVCKATKPAHKLSFRWCRPRRVISVKSPAVCVVAYLTTEKQETVHVAWMKKYCGQLDDTEVPDEVLDLAYRTAAKYKIVENIAEIQENDEGIWLRLQWEGLHTERDFTWARLSDMYEDIPEMVVAFLKASIEKEITAVATRQLGISL